MQRRLGVFDATMIVMGGIIGSGIFATPYVVARGVHSAPLILLAWAAGGAIALLGAFIWAELAATRPDVGGQYAYLRDAYHPVVAFVYGWSLLLVIQTGGMAAVSVAFASYFSELFPTPGIGEPLIAVIAVALLVTVNCLGVRAGSTVQNTLMILKICAIVLLICAGLFIAPAPASTPAAHSVQDSPLLLAFGAVMIPVMFSYGGWQTASFLAGEMRNPQRDLARGLILGVMGVIALYLLVNVALIRGLGVEGLAATTTPATTLMRGTFGETGARLIAVGITISTIGFLSQGMLTAPRVYYAMARDKVFFDAVGRLEPRTQAPMVAIVLQGLMTIAIALSGTFDLILSYVVSVDFIFFGLTAGAVFVFRSRQGGQAASGAARVPGHPYTTGVFIIAAALIVLNTFVTTTEPSLIGAAFMLTGVPVYFLWKRLTN